MDKLTNPIKIDAKAVRAALHGTDSKDVRNFALGVNLNPETQLMTTCDGRMLISIHTPQLAELPHDVTIQFHKLPVKTAVWVYFDGLNAWATDKKGLETQLPITLLDGQYPDTSRVNISDYKSEDQKNDILTAPALLLRASKAIVEISTAKYPQMKIELVTELNRLYISTPDNPDIKITVMAMQPLKKEKN